MSRYCPSVSDVRRAIRGGNASFATFCCLLRRCSAQAMNYGNGTSLICHTQLRSNAAEMNGTAGGMPGWDVRSIDAPEIFCLVGLRDSSP
jgi:hypothetical protein